jgi:hypothetical protein
MTRYAGRSPRELLLRSGCPGCKECEPRPGLLDINTTPRRNGTLFLPLLTHSGRSVRAAVSVGRLCSTEKAGTILRLLTGVHLPVRQSKHTLHAAGRGRRPTYAAEARARIVATAQRSPNRRTDGTATWSLSTLQRTLRRGSFPHSRHEHHSARAARRGQFVPADAHLVRLAIAHGIDRRVERRRADRDESH